MNERDEAIAYYKNREFYEITVQSDGTRLLEGPIDTIRKAVPSAIAVDESASDKTYYSYVQVIDGRIVRAFKQDQIAERLIGTKG